MGVVLVDGSQVCDQHLSDRHRLGPGAVDLHDGEVLLLAPKDVRSKLVCIAWGRALELVVLRAEQIRQISREVKLDGEELLDEVPASAEPIDLLVAVEHDHAMRVAGCDLRGFPVVLLVDEKRPGRQL